MLLLRYYWRRTVVVVIVALALGYAALGLIEPAYQADATILVEPRQHDATGTPITAVDGPHIASLVQMLRSPDTMALAVERLGLSRMEEFVGQHGGLQAEEEAVRQLSDQITVTAGEETALIYLVGRSGNAELARDITLAVAQAGLDRRAMMITADVEQAADWLEHSIEQLRADVVAADHAVADFMAQHGLVSVTDQGTLNKQRLADLEGRTQAARERSAAAGARARVWQDWQDMGSASLHTVLADGTNRALLREYAKAQAELAGLSSSLGPDHPVSRAAMRQSAELQTQLAAAVDVAIGEAETQAAAEAALAVALEAERYDALMQLSAEINENPELSALRREATAQRTVLEAYLARYQSASALVEPGAILPDMRIISHPLTPAVASVPGKGMMMISVAIVAAMSLLTAGVIMLQSGHRRHAIRAAPQLVPGTETTELGGLHVCLLAMHHKTGLSGIHPISDIPQHVSKGRVGAASCPSAFRSMKLDSCRSPKGSDKGNTRPVFAAPR